MGKLATVDSKFPKRDLTLPSLLAKQVDDTKRIDCRQINRQDGRESLDHRFDRSERETSNDRKLRASVLVWSRILRNLDFLKCDKSPIYEMEFPRVCIRKNRLCLERERNARKISRDTICAQQRSVSLDHCIATSRSSR